MASTYKYFCVLNFKYQFKILGHCLFKKHEFPAGHPVVSGRPGLAQHRPGADAANAPTHLLSNRVTG